MCHEQPLRAQKSDGYVQKEHNEVGALVEALYREIGGRKGAVGSEEAGLGR